jgi:beta propeller repeat protein
MKTPLCHLIRLLALLLLAPGAARAQEQYTGLCAEVKIVISQQLTLERVGFLATLQLTDNDPSNPITDFAANLTFSNPANDTNGTVDDSSGLFFVQPPNLQNITDVNGGGVIGPGQTATVSWFIIPTVSAGGTNPNGIRYQVGANLSGQSYGVAVPGQTLQVYPASITFAPDAQLEINYFTPRDVIGIDPITGQGSPIPFTFGVLVQNVGYGMANSMTIQSQQPQIVENKQNLLIVAQLLGSRVNDSALSNADLTVNLGNLQPGQAAKGAWDMIVSLSGTFLSVNASYTHSTALGGTETSLIKSVNAYLFLHEVLDDQPGRDNIRDFLADTSGALDAVDNLIPDSLYESEGGVYPVNFLTNASVTTSGNPFQAALNANFAGWGYMRLADPGQAKLPIASIIRSDGKVLNTNNYWTSIHYEPITNLKDTYLNILDLVNLGSYTYTVTYTNIPPNTNAPVTSLMFAGPSVYNNGIYYVTPQTQMYFLAQDAQPVTIYDSLTNAPFGLAFPFSLPAPGSYQLSYYGIDTSSNQESPHTVTLVLPGAGALGFANASVSPQPIFDPGGALSVRPRSVPISFQALADPTAVNAQIDVFQGVVGWVTVSNVPSSPSAGASASLNIGGQNVDYYSYQLNSGGWSGDQPVSQPLTLSALPSGSNYVSVLGRSQYGSYLDPSNAVTVGWVVSSSAPSTVLTGAPATPAAAGAAQLAVSGAGVTNYQWTINNGVNNSYYRAPAPVSSPIILSNLAATQQVVAVLGEVNGAWQNTNNATSVQWVVNPLYGYSPGPLSNVFTASFTNVGSSPVNFSWNGLSGAGVVQPPGWYTVRLTLSDSLGNTNFTVGLAQIGNFAGTSNVLAGPARGPLHPFARGRWAAWQDQSDGNWEIYAQDITVSGSAIQKITQTSLSQENPRTDGRYIVWQGQEANGNWDVFLNDMQSAAGPQPLTSTPVTDEVNPAIDWPWVVYQSRATGNTNAPWLLIATNLSTRQSFQVSPSTLDEISPAVQAGRVVWQDMRNPGAGEIYFCDLSSGAVQRLTTNTFGKYNPAIYDNWVVWQDGRNIEADLYGFDLLRHREIRITDTPEDELQPSLNGPWVVCIDNSLGPQTGNVRVIHLPSLITIPITSTLTSKASPALADGACVWLETVSNQAQVVSTRLPSLQAVFANRNVVAVTPAMVSYAQDAFGLLALWAANGVQSATEYTALTPQVTTQTATWANGAPAGQNFSLTAGTFLWIQFNTNQVLDLGVNNTSPLNLAAGANVFGYSGFPDAYSAFTLLRQIGLGNALSVRMLDAQSGRWRVALVQGGSLVGDNFPIPNSAVLMVNVAGAVSQFMPQSE